MIRILHILSSLDMGGIESFLLNIYRNIDRQEIQFDFLVPDIHKFYFEDEIRMLGGKIFKVPPKSRHMLQNINAVRTIVKSSRYQIVHRHSGSATMFIDLFSAGLGGAKVRIAHSHNSRKLDEYLSGRNIKQYAVRPLLNCICTNRLACSGNAALWMFGKQKVLKNKVKIINNAIKLDKFIYNEEIRRHMRGLYKIDDYYVIGHVGAFRDTKNHEFMIDVFHELCRNNSKLVLMFVGDGTLRDACILKARELGLSDRIIFCGNVSEPERYLNAMDLFIMPSSYEGIPLAIIEAQLNGLKIIASSSITQDVGIGGDITFCGLDGGVKKWAELIERHIGEAYTRDLPSNSAEYDVESIANELQRYYLSLCISRN